MRTEKQLGSINVNFEVWNLNFEIYDYSYSYLSFGTQNFEQNYLLKSLCQHIWTLKFKS